MPDESRTRVPSPDDWYRAVMADRTITGETRAVLMHLAREMDGQRRVSIPQTALATCFGVSKMRIQQRIKEAHEKGLLSTVQRGRPRVTAVYQGTFPASNYGTPGGATEGKFYAPEGGAKEPPSYGTPGGVAISKQMVTSAVELPLIRGLESPRHHRGEAGVVKHGIDVVDGETPKGTPKLGSGTAVDHAANGSAEVLKSTGTNGVVRSRLIDEILRCASSDGIPSEDLLSLLEEAHGQQVSDYVVNYWHVSRKATTRYAAGIELNKMVNTARSAA